MTEKRDSKLLASVRLGCWSVPQGAIAVPRTHEIGEGGIHPVNLQTIGGGNEAREQGNPEYSHTRALRKQDLVDLVQFLKVS